MRRISILLIVVALIAGMVGCGGVVKYDLAISSTAGGSVTTPGEAGPYAYDEGTDVELVAEAEEGYRFVNWTGDVVDIANVEDATTIIIMNDDYSITANFVKQKYDLTIASTAGGSVTSPGEDTFTYDGGTVVDLVAQPDEGYQFMKWTGNVGAIADVNADSTTITMNGDYSITASFGIGIYDWYDLDAIRDNLGGSYILMNDLDSTTAGYAELAGATANGGEGWRPIGNIYPGPAYWDIVESIDPFTGTFDGQGYEIRDLFIDHPDEGCVALFGWLDSGGIIQDVGVVDVTVIGTWDVGGLVGRIGYGAVSNSYSTGSVTGEWCVGGLVGRMYYGYGTVSNSYSTSSVVGHTDIGGLVGSNEQGTINDSYTTGNVAGDRRVGGLVGFHGWATISNSHYNYGEVLINGKNVVTIGALFSEDFEQWLANDKSLDVNQRLSQEDGYYLINNVDDFKQLLSVGQDGSLKFRLTSDLDLADEPNFYIPYLAGEFDGSGHRIMNFNFCFDFVAPVGLFGYLDSSGKVSEVDVESVDITGDSHVGGLVGESAGTVNNAYSRGSVTGTEWVGGLVGWNNGIVSNSYSTGSVNGQSSAGGLTGKNTRTVSNSYYNYSEVLINGQNVITVGALFGEDFDQWLANDKFLDVNERLSQEDGYYLINNMGDFKEFLAFGQDSSLKFRLQNDLDLATEPNFYIPYLAGEFDGNGHRIMNLSCGFDFVASVGLFGYLAPGGKVTQVGAVNVNVIGYSYVGGLVGDNWGSVSQCYSTGSLTGMGFVGGLLGHNHHIATVSNSYFTGSVTADWAVGGLSGDNWGIVNNCYSDSTVTGEGEVGGLVGTNAWEGTVSNSYSTGSVTGYRQVGGIIGLNRGTVNNSYATASVTGAEDVGGLVGHNDGNVGSSFWDTQTSGQATSASGTGVTTAEMKSIATFSSAGWNITAVANLGTRNPAYIWNIVDGQTYPFLSW